MCREATCAGQKTTGTHVHRGSCVSVGQKGTGKQDMLKEVHDREAQGRGLTKHFPDRWAMRGW